MSDVLLISKTNLLTGIEHGGVLSFCQPQAMVSWPERMGKSGSFFAQPKRVADGEILHADPHRCRYLPSLLNMPLFGVDVGLAQLEAWFQGSR
jgi:hypothetical protein